MSLGRIVVDLLAKTGSFETDLNRSAKLAEKRAREIDRQFKAAGKAIGLAMVAAAGVVGVAIKNSIDRMDDLSKAAQRANMPTEEFSRLAYAGSLADVAMEDLQKSMGKLAKAQGDAAQGLTTQVRGFEALGIAFKNTDGSLRSTFDVFLDFADALQKHKGSPEVLALGMQVFGRSFQNLIPLLKDGRAGLQAMADESDRLGATISTEAGAAAEEFNDNLTRLQTAAMGLANEVASNLLPDLLELSGAFVGAANDGDTLKETAGEISDFLRGLAQVAHVVSSAFEIMGTSMASSAVLARSLMQLLSGDAQGSADSVRDAYRMIGDEWREAFADKPKRDPRFARVSGSAKGSWEGGDSEGLRIVDPASAKAAEAAAERIRKALEDMAKRAADDLQKMVEAEDRARQGFDAMAASLAGPLAAAHHQYKQDQAELNRLAEEGSVSADKLREAQANLTAQHEKDVEAIRARLNPAQQVLADLRLEIEITRAVGVEKDKLLALRYANVDALSAEGQAIAATIEELERAREAEALILDLQGVFTDFAVDAIGDFGSIGDAFEDMADRMKRIAIQLLAEKAIQWLFNYFGGSMGGGPQHTPGGASEGAAYDAWFNANGGAGQVMPMPTGGGQVSGMMPSGGAQVSVEVINNTGQPSREEQTKGPDGRLIQRIIIGEMKSAIRSGELDSDAGMAWGVRRQGAFRG